VAADDPQTQEETMPHDPDATGPVPTDVTRESPPVTSGAAAPAGAPASPASPTPTGHPVTATGPAPAVGAKKSWRSRVSRGPGLAVAALVVGLGLGAVGGSAGTWAVTHDEPTGPVADGTAGFDRDGHGGFGPPGGRRGMPPGGGEAPNGTQQDGGAPGQLPGGGGSGPTDANGAAEAT
jgi:hypothetical protein